MNENLNKVIRELSEVYDKESDDTFISLYLSKYKDRKFLDRRIKIIRSILKDESLKNLIRLYQI